MNCPCDTCKHCKKTFGFVGQKYCVYGLLVFNTFATFACACYDRKLQFKYFLRNEREE